MSKKKELYELSVDAKELIAAEPAAKINRHGTIYHLANLTQSQMAALKDTQYIIAKDKLD